jgi:hypothetical protein
MSTDEYEALRREADGTRDRLMSTLDRLHQRRHELTNVRLQLKQHPVVAFSVAITALAGLSLVGVLAYRRARREEHTWRERGRALERAWSSPHRVASSRQGPFGEELGRRILLGVLGFAAVELGKQGVRRLLPASAGK